MSSSRLSVSVQSSEHRTSVLKNLNVLDGPNGSLFPYWHHSQFWETFPSSVIPLGKQIFMLLLISMCIYREKQKYIQDLYCTERYLTKTQLLLGYNCWSKYIRAMWVSLSSCCSFCFCLLFSLCCVVHCVMWWYCETDFFLVSLFLCFNTKCVIWWKNAATRDLDPAGAQCEHCQPAPEPSMSPARF